MSYAYTSARVSALENRLIGSDTVEQLISGGSAEECIRILNSAGVAGDSAEAVLDTLARDAAELTDQLIEDKSDIEIIFYKKSFQNLKAAVKQLYMKDSQRRMYVSAPVTGEFIEKAISDGRYDLLPEYMREAAKEAYSAILRTGDGQLSDIIADRACLEAMKKFAAATKFSILKKYAYETVAAADIKTALRFAGGENERLTQALADCPYFKADELASAADSKKSVAEFAASAGLTDIDIENVDKWSGERIAKILAQEKYEIFTPSPAINFVLTLERQQELIRLILLCKQNGVSEEFIRRKAVRADV